MNTPDISAIANYAGRFEKNLYANIVNGLEVAKDVALMPNVKNKMTLTKLAVANGLRPYTPDDTIFNDQDLKYTPRELVVRLGKRQLLIEPLKYRETYQSEVMSGGVNPMEIPFAAFVYQKILEQLQSEINDVTAYFGIYDSAGDEAVDVADGLGKILDDEVTATNIAPLATGAITDGPSAIAVFDQMHRSNKPALRNAGTVTHCSYADWDFLLDGLMEQQKFNRTDVEEQGWLYLPKSTRKNIVKPCSWLGDSRRIINTEAMKAGGKLTTRSLNLTMGFDSLNDMKKIRTIEKLWTLQMGVALAIGFQIRNTEEININDQP